MKYILIILLFFSFSCKTSPSSISIAFYNVENLFDTEDDPKIDDSYYLPSSPIKWDVEKYNKKLNDLAFVISQLADNEIPQFIGLCEVENLKVVKDLANQEKLKAGNFGIVHYDSEDERGIDVAFLYNKTIFSVKETKTYQIPLPDNDKTRDILYVKGKLANGETLYFLINHWPSRSEGRIETEAKRITAAQTLKTAKDEKLANDKNAKIIAMGDFNDEPSNVSLSKYCDSEGDLDKVDANEFYNPMAALENKDLGSYRFRDYWDMLDQIMVSQALLKPAKNKVYYQKNSASIKDEDWMKQHGNKYEGFPLRTFGGQNYLGGYSDHFPVYIKLIIQANK